MREGRVKANGIEFAYLEEGAGPLVLLLHGFPDNAHTWSHHLPALAATGYRAVAPFMRGYPPSDPGEYYDTATLAADAHALIGALGGGEPAFVVGHDWGALTTYGVCAAFPESVRRAVAMAVPHPAGAATFLSSYDQLRRSFYIWFFQLPGLPEMAVAADDLAFIERLWRDWSPGLDDPEHVASVKRTLSEPGALDAAIGYYRALFDPARGDPTLEEVRRATQRDITVPALVMFGGDDGCLSPEFARAGDPFFRGEYRVEVLPRCGHFLHRERPQEITQLITDWLAIG